MGNSRKLSLLCSERSKMPSLEVDVLLGGTGFVTLSKELMDTELPVAGRLLPYFASWAIPPSMVQVRMACKTANSISHRLGLCRLEKWGGESKIWLTMLLFVVICLLDAWLTSQVPNKLTSLLKTHGHGTAPQLTPDGGISCLLL